MAGTSPATTKKHSPPFANVNVDIKIDLADAGLLRSMRAALVPSGRRASATYVGEPQAAPLRQVARTFAAELPGQHDLFAALVGADDVRAEFAEAAVIRGMSTCCSLRMALRNRV